MKFTCYNKLSYNTEDKVKRCVAVLFSSELLIPTNTKYKALSLVFMRRCEGVVSFLTWRHIVHPKIKNNHQPCHSSGALPPGLCRFVIKNKTADSQSQMLQ